MEEPPEYLVFMEHGSGAQSLLVLDPPSLVLDPPSLELEPPSLELEEGSYFNTFSIWVA